ncbi:dGTP triphosphohydrolase [Niabella sp. CJ426]|uniref:dGTP triphosphohydrolase n=1 Tax=Niabella sp. CJ426 TaxID=3393740 RepID=UPI003CFFF93E
MLDWKKLINKERLKKSKLKDDRNEFESDYGRIIYSPALRRMHDKTQVFPLTTDDNIHSRLTHSNEVMSLGYTFGLKLSKSELIQKKTGLQEVELLRILPVLLQNICLIHDIGNAPFGHFGETIVSDYFKNLKGKKNKSFLKLSEHQQRDFLYYDGNAQGLRVITKLQYLDNPFGLNLTLGTLASYLKYPNYENINKVKEEKLKKIGRLLKQKEIECSKHGVFYSEIKYFEKIVDECGLKVKDKIVRHPLCYLMEAADSIAYLCMDMEDGFNKNIYGIKDIEDEFSRSKGEIAEEIISICRNSYYDDNTKIVNIRIKLIGHLVQLAFTNFEKNLKKIEIGTYNQELIKDDPNKIYKALESFSSKIFKSREINYLESTGHSVFTGLLDFYIEFLFHDNEKYVKRAKHLISRSIIECAIEENLLTIGDVKFEKMLKSLRKDVSTFKKKGPEKARDLEKEAEKIKQHKAKFGELKTSYEVLFENQQMRPLTVLEESELKRLRFEIRGIINPDFDDLNEYYKFRVILDFISGMTDQFAVAHYQKISGQKIN